MRFRIKVFCAWYDGWIGYYFNRTDRALYLCPIPFVVLKLWRVPKPTIEWHEQEAMDSVHRLAYSSSDSSLARRGALSRVVVRAAELSHYLEMCEKGFDCK